MTTQLYLTPADHGRKLTLEEFLSSDSKEGYQYEIIHGRLEVTPLPNLPHDVLRKWLERVFDDYAEEHPEVINRVQAPARVFLPDRAGAGRRRLPGFSPGAANRGMELARRVSDPRRGDPVRG